MQISSEFTVRFYFVAKLLFTGTSLFTYFQVLKGEKTWFNPKEKFCNNAMHCVLLLLVCDLFIFQLSGRKTIKRRRSFATLSLNKNSNDASVPFSFPLLYCGSVFYVLGRETFGLFLRKC